MNDKNEILSSPNGFVKLNIVTLLKRSKKKPIKIIDELKKTFFNIKQILAMSLTWL